ncbi:recombinase family protein, partial [uncultured Oscillibacter sp.]|uniref:recombinase family protein n=1 Tax=uncultured Oscillibacter sp. TaxID=876091 RepID=UPI00345B65F1
MISSFSSMSCGKDKATKDAVFESDLILANGLGEKALGLNNITVKGRLVVWGGSAVNISGKSTVASVVTPRNDGPVQVVFDAAAAELSEKDCAIVYPSGMDKGKGVRFIAVNNNIDSAQPSDNDFAPFLNIMNEYYAKDTSKKIKAIFRSRMQAGKRCSGSVPYGYTRLDGDKQTLVVDEEAAAVVRRIFRLACEGQGPTQIAETLTQDKVDILIKGLYESNMLGKLPDRQYQRLMNQYDSEQAALEQRRTEL